MTTNHALRNLTVRYDVQPVEMRVGTTADLLAGCDCPTCAPRGRPVRVVCARLPLSDGRVRDVLFYGNAGGRVGVVDATVSVPPRHTGTLGLETGAWRWP